MSLDTHRTASGPVASSGPEAPPSFAEALRFRLKLGSISFGGPTGQIAIMHAEPVEKRKWIGDGGEPSFPRVAATGPTGLLYDRLSP